MISPWISIEVEYFPVRYPSDEEARDANIYAANVRNELSKATGEDVARCVVGM